jgi:IMP dehydrogenase/GMP reductase
MRVNTGNGLIPIKDIKIGDMVYTHLGRLKKVIGKISYPINENIMVINNKIMCTKNHEFYVLPKYILSKDYSYKTTIHKDNIHEYAKWVDASSLTVDFRLIDLTTMKSMPITSIEKIEYNGIVYDLSVEEDKSYNIENIIVHNSVCTTRKKSGSGVPMITSILECASVAEEFDIPIIADGGIRYEGDVAKAIGAGADTVMLGSLLAGTDESPGDLIDVSYEINSGKVKVYRGSASRECKMKSGNTSNVEGVSRYINYKGSVESVISAIIDGLRSAMSYSGSCNINEMKEKCIFRQVTNSGVIEASPHLK